jgi:hypothetical protein
MLEIRAAFTAFDGAITHGIAVARQGGVTPWGAWR